MKVVEGKFVVDKFIPKRATLDRVTSDKIKKRECSRKINQEAEDFAKTVMGWF